MALVPHDTYHHLLWWAKPSRPLLDFFAHTPVIFQSHGRLAGLTARSPGEPGTAAELLELQRSLAIPGLQQLVVMSASSQELASASSLLLAPHASPTEPTILWSCAALTVPTRVCRNMLMAGVGVKHLDTFPGHLRSRRARPTPFI